MMIGGLQLPSLYEVEQKADAIKEASAYSFKESDVDQVNNNYSVFRHFFEQGRGDHVDCIH